MNSKVFPTVPRLQKKGEQGASPSPADRTICTALTFHFIRCCLRGTSSHSDPASHTSCLRFVSSPGSGSLIVVNNSVRGRLDIAPLHAFVSAPISASPHGRHSSAGVIVGKAATKGSVDVLLWKAIGEDSTDIQCARVLAGEGRHELSFVTAYWSVSTSFGEMSGAPHREGVQLAKGQTAIVMLRRSA